MNKRENYTLVHQTGSIGKVHSSFFYATILCPKIVHQASKAPILIKLAISFDLYYIFDKNIFEYTGQSKTA